MTAIDYVALERRLAQLAEQRGPQGARPDALYDHFAERRAAALARLAELEVCRDAVQHHATVVGLSGGIAALGVLALPTATVALPQAATLGALSMSYFVARLLVQAVQELRVERELSRTAASAKAATLPRAEIEGPPVTQGALTRLYGRTAARWARLTGQLSPAARPSGNPPQQAERANGWSVVPQEGKPMHASQAAQEAASSGPAHAHYYGRLTCTPSGADYARSLQVELLAPTAAGDGLATRYRVRLDPSQLALLSSMSADFLLDVRCRPDDAGRTPIWEMSGAQLEAEQAYCDWAIAASVPYTPAGTRDGWYAATGRGFASAPPQPSAATYFQLRDAIRDELVARGRADARPAVRTPGAQVSDLAPQG